MERTNTLTFPRTAHPASSSRPVRVCFLIDQLARAGTESQLLALIEHLDRSRVEPILCLLDGTSAESRSLEPANCPILRLGVRSLHWPRSMLQAVRLARILRAYRVDVLQVYFPDSTLFGVPVARLAGVPRVVRTRNNLGYSLTRLQRWLGRLYNHLVDVTVANCAACREAVLIHERPNPESVVVLENGVDLARFAMSKGHPSARIKDRARRVGMVANLRPVKEPGVFLQAARIVTAAEPDVRFEIAGEGELRPWLEEEITRQGLQGGFRLAGAVADVPGFLAGLDVAVLCSCSEGQSNALLEYMAAGRAVVATAVGGNLELIEPGVNGLLVPPGDPEELARAIIRLLREPALAARLGAAARQLVEARYSLQARARRFEDFYMRLVGKDRLHPGPSSSAACGLALSPGERR
ncbi:MAG TPA: glycosyltransferase [Gemmataceae bacterium]|nr:glycosyltransferase [Gemmataceae bacterium]